MAIIKYMFFCTWLLLFYEQNNLSAFKKMFLEQVEFAMKEYF